MQTQQASISSEFSVIYAVLSLRDAVDLVQATRVVSLNFLPRFFFRDSTAGRTVKTGLTASVIVSQWTWAATLLQSSNVAWNYGVSGPFW
jgi:hypothetical protein